MSDDWYEHVLIDGRREHAYDAYLNHPASGAKAKRRGESTDTILCNCTDEQSRKHMEDRPQMAPNKTPMAPTLEGACNNWRAELLNVEHYVRALVTEKKVSGEAAAQAMLSVRHLEDARMRLGKVIQYSGDGVSCFDK